MRIFIAVFFLVLFCFFNVQEGAAQTCILTDYTQDFTDKKLDRFLERYTATLETLEHSAASCVHEQSIKIHNLAVTKNEISICNALFKLSIQWDEKHQVNDSLTCRKFALLGANQKYLRDIKSAYQSLNKALSIAKKYYSIGDQEIYKIYQNLAECYYLEGKTDTSLFYLDTAYINIGIDEFEVRKSRSFQYLAKNYAKIGDYFLYDMYSSAYLPYLEEYKPRSVKKFYLDLARGLAILQKNKASNEVLEDYIQRHPEDSSNDIFHDIKAYNHYDLKEYKEAVFHLNKVYELDIEKGDGLSRLQALSNKVLIHELKTEYEASLSVSKELQQLSTELGNQQYLRQAYNQHFQTLCFLKRYKEAYQEYKGIEKHVFEEKKSEFASYDIESEYFLAAIEMLMGLAELGDVKFLKEGYELVVRMDRLTSQRIETFVSDNSSLMKLELKREVYLKAIELCYKIYEKEKDQTYLNKALELIEQNKAVVLYNNARDKINIKSSQKKLLENGIKDSLLILKSICRNVEIEKKLRLSAANDIYKLTDQLIKLNDNDTVKLSKKIKIQDYIAGASGCHLSYMIDDSILYRMFLSKDHQLFDRIQVSPEAMAWLNNMSIACASSTGIVDQDILEQISLWLLPKEVTLYDRLTVLPDGILNSLPFEVLRLGGKSLLETKEIAYAYSLQHQAGMLERRASPTDNIICFAPSYDRNHMTAEGYNNLTSLLFNNSEVKAIKSAFSTAINYIDQRALKETFVKQAPAASVLHLAAHAKSDTTEEGCHIYFSNYEEDYILSLSEIYKMTIPAELVTLSACETATGENLASEGVLSLARGFAYAGSKSVVSSLWAANDQSTSMIMSAFYKYLKEGHRKDKALRLAKLDFLDQSDTEYHHPYYWAAFIPVGDMSPLVVDQKPYWLYVLGAILIGAGGLGFRKKAKAA